MSRSKSNGACYKAGATAYRDAKEIGVTNPHPPGSSEEKYWNDGYIDGQKVLFLENSGINRERDILHLKSFRPTNSFD